MAIFNKEIRKGVKGFGIWTGVIAFMLLVCVFLYPEMKDQMGGMNDLFANMGSFTEAFGMDKLNFGTLIGFYGVECGNILGIGGGFFAAYLGITMLAKEEKDHTAEFILSHPQKRSAVVLQKLLAVVWQVLLLNVIILAFGTASIAAIGEEIPINELLLIHGAYLILQMEVSLICFGISAFLRRGSIGIGLGIAALMYFMNLIINISDKAEFLKYITPYAYAEPATIIEDMSLDLGLVAVGLAYAAVMVILGFAKYCHKDIAS